jgi:EpsI family protein
VGGLGSSILLALSVLATVAAQFVGIGAEREVVATAPLAEIPLQLGPWKGKDLAVPNYVTEMLTYDTVLHRAYAGPLGYRANVWVIFWSSQSMVKGYHHPDVCWQNKGFRMMSRAVVPADLRGCTIPITTREFEKHKTDRQLILYWTQEGRRVWTEDDERAAQIGGDSHGWLGERLFRRAPPDATGRLVVLIGTEVWGDGAENRAQTLEFAKRIADAVYDVCPWADPRAR